MHFIHDPIYAYSLAGLRATPIRLGIKGYIDSALDNGLRTILNNYLLSSFSAITRLLGIEGKFKLPIHHKSTIGSATGPAAPAQGPAALIQGPAASVQASVATTQPPTVYDPIRILD